MSVLDILLEQKKMDKKIIRAKFVDYGDRYCIQNCYKLAKKLLNKRGITIEFTERHFLKFKI